MNIGNQHSIFRMIFHSILFSITLSIVIFLVEFKMKMQLLGGNNSYLLILPFIYLFFLIYRNIRKKRRLLRSDILDVDKMTGTDFELFLYYHFKNLGYKVRLTPITHDYGADLILKYKRQVTAVQAKRWNESVGIKAVQEIVGATKYYQADYAMVITNSIFTKSAKVLADVNEVELIDRKGLIHLMGQTESGNTIIDMQEDDKTFTCPFCGGKMIIRSGNYGEFYGCVNYPNCKYTKNIS